ncbi:hypothetical protein B0A48_02117 [Cryoendolithus antarcticus]|uniref:Endonuclease/exonuclease/phosphatase domain-containing protein n=1 Tax=Cryoendolithus antarcticus TaxID=1507870 RepID=A0A1V8TMX3_9PEZI|nr:hypothetical protein B0A48_02117 [Cryoendolithus antarcticus]
MDEVIKEQISIIHNNIKTDVPWEQDESFPQPFHLYDPSASQWFAHASTAHQVPTSTETTHLELFSWNIDFMLPFGDSRMTAALAHLDSLISELPESTASVIFLQECTPSDLRLLASTPWIQQHFAITDLDNSMWANAHYGTTTLISRKYPVQQVFRVHFSATNQERDGLFADLLLDDHKLFRLCNTHLESLALKPPLRPKQLELIAAHLHSSALAFALVAGDFNAIEPFDRSLHTENNLADAFLSLRGQEDTDKAYTWGQQAATHLREQFGRSRMDKIFFRGDGARCLDFKRFGDGVEVASEDEKGKIVGLGFERAWVTDHLGVRGRFELGGGGGKGESDESGRGKL